MTPAQVANLIEESGGDTDMVDGYDELPQDMKEKVDFALENGHVADEDWKGVCTATTTATYECSISTGCRVQQTWRQRLPGQGTQESEGQERAGGTSTLN